MMWTHQLSVVYYNLGAHISNKRCAFQFRCVHINLCNMISNLSYMNINWADCLSFLILISIVCVCVIFQIFWNEWYWKWWTKCWTWKWTKKRATERSKGKMYTFISDHTYSITPHELITNPEGIFFSKC